MPRVQSTAILRVHYDEPRRELEVTFTGGRTYTYLGVPREVYARFLETPSKGRFLNAQVKNHYDFRPSRRRRDARRAHAARTTRGW